MLACKILDLFLNKFSIFVSVSTKLVGNCTHVIYGSRSVKICGHSNTAVLFTKIVKFFGYPSLVYGLEGYRSVQINLIYCLNNLQPNP